MFRFLCSREGVRNISTLTIFDKFRHILISSYKKHENFKNI